MSKTILLPPRASTPAIVIFVFALLAMGSSRVAEGSEWQFIGSRYQGMGGAGVAVVDDSLALYWNPGTAHRRSRGV